MTLRGALTECWFGFTLVRCQRFLVHRYLVNPRGMHDSHVLKEDAGKGSVTGVC
jgi:hypothetical protein